MLIQFRCAVILAVLVSKAGFAQARIVSAPPEPSLLNITRQWSVASSLGDLRELHVGADHRELRVWAGFGLNTETQAVVLRRDKGHWSASLARVLRCELQIPRVVGETASRGTLEHYTALAKGQCGTKLRDVMPGAQIITTDSLFVVPIDLPESAIEEAWTAAMHAGASELPPRVQRDREMDDAFMYVVELRNGDEYRASAIEHLEPPVTQTDRQVQDVYAAINRVLKDDQVLKP